MASIFISSCNLENFCAKFHAELCNLLSTIKLGATLNEQNKDF